MGLALQGGVAHDLAAVTTLGSSLPRMRRWVKPLVHFLCLANLFALTACPGKPKRSDKGKGRQRHEQTRRVDSRPPPLSKPVPLWEKGKSTRMIDAAKASEEGYVVVDLGEEWTPYIFTERGSENEEPVANAYRATYLALARGEFPDDHHGRRAANDKYLELYGIMPTLSLLRERFRKVKALPCAQSMDLKPFQEFEGLVAYQNNDEARAMSRRHKLLDKQLSELAQQQGVADATQLDVSKLNTKEAAALKEYLKLVPKVRIVRAVQERMRCEGYGEGRGEFTPGGLDWSTHQAIAEFERRHRVYGWGFIGKETLAMLRRTPLDLEREAVIRVLTERVMHAAGVLEDGSAARMAGKNRGFKGKDGRWHPWPNLESELRKQVIEAFGLQTPESALAWLESLKLERDKALWVAIDNVELPEYYDGDMELSAVIDRGDVWYEFPFDDAGRPRSQPVGRRPTITIFTQYEGQKIPLATYGTTIGGWRSEWSGNTLMWKYKNSPVGPRVWHQVVAAPVWLPPDGTPPRSLLKRVPGGEGKERYEVDLHEVGPSYASAYGLVAAYHMKYRQGENGRIHYGGDEGIRTHGSVDYMSIMRRHSHGCHRLHNHLAVRLMSFVLAHRPHVRVGQQKISTFRNLPHEGHVYQLQLKHGGYVFDLKRPVPVEVLEGRIRGDLKSPVGHVIPEYNAEVGAYVDADAGTVTVDRWGRVKPRAWPTDDAGVPKAGATLPKGVVPPTPGVPAGAQNAPAGEGAP